MWKLGIAITSALLLSPAAAAVAQANAAAPLPAFDVTSVRPFKPAGPWHRDAR